MKKISKARVITRAFLKDKSQIPDWHSERLEICKSCIFNSANSENATSINKKIPKCTACGCFILEKTSQETEMCGMSELGKQPLWPALKVETSSSNDLDMINLSPDKINVNLNKDYYIVEYGDIKLRSNSLVNLEFQSKDIIKPVEVKSTCGCTTPNKPLITKNNNILISLSVKTTSLGRVSSMVTLYYLKGDNQKSIKIRVIANVIN